MTPDHGDRDGRVKRILDRALERQLSQVAHAVAVGQRDGTVRGSAHPGDAARLVVAIISGVRVMAQAGSTPEELRRMAILGLDALKP